MRLFRGIVVPSAEAESVISSISYGGLDKDRGWLMVWEKPVDPERLFQKHGPSGGDDHANALFGALYIASHDLGRVSSCVPVIVSNGPRVFPGDDAGVGRNPAIGYGAGYRGEGGSGSRKGGYEWLT